MRRTIFCVLVVLVIGIISSHVLMAVPQESGDNYGILKGQIIDEETGEPVAEHFLVSLTESNVEAAYQIKTKGYKTDKKGYFSFRWEPGSYLLYFQPTSPTSKYCRDRNPISYPESKQIIQIEKGKVTEIIKKAQLGGKLKLTMETQTGERINPILIFGENVDVRVQIWGKSLLDNESEIRFTDGDTFSDGEILMHSLCPDLYEVKIEFGGMGILTKNLKNIEVKKDEITEVGVIVDFHGQTGIEGTILYTDGTPIENVRVGVFGPEGASKKSGASVYTDKNGYYKIVGLEEGLYDVIFSKRLGKTRFLSIRPREVAVKSGFLSPLDIMVNLPK